MYYFFEQLLLAFAEILGSLFSQPSIWWLLAPLIFFWLVLEFYFGTYKTEQLGWNTALGNGMSLVWVSVDSMRFLWENPPVNFLFRFLIILSFLFYGSFIIYISFAHKFSSKLTYILASPSPIYFFSCVVVLWGHGILKLTWWVFIDLMISYCLLLFFVWLLRKFLPGAKKSGSLDKSVV